MGCGVYWTQIREVEKAMRTMRRFGIPESADAFRSLSATRGKLLRQVGLKYPRGIIQLIKLLGLSPGEIILEEDVEAGFMVRARERPGAPWATRYVSDEIAMTILKKEVSQELHDFLMTPDPYVGE